MADQTYNLTQTGAEVQAIINDANGVKGAGATTSLTTDYIMLKDTSGNYHKIQKSSFTEAVRNTLASLLVNNDKGTTISQIAAIASGDFGSVTPANLASVLGMTYLKEDVDFNNMLETFENGIYLVKFNQSSLPSWASTLISYSQVIVTKQGPANVFFEIYEGDINPKHFRLIYSRATNSIKTVHEYFVTKLSI